MRLSTRIFQDLAYPVKILPPSVTCHVQGPRRPRLPPSERRHASDDHRGEPPLLEMVKHARQQRNDIVRKLQGSSLLFRSPGLQRCRAQLKPAHHPFTRVLIPVKTQVEQSLAHPSRPQDGPTLLQGILCGLAPAHQGAMGPAARKTFEPVRCPHGSVERQFKWMNTLSRTNITTEDHSTLKGPKR